MHARDESIARERVPEPMLMEEPHAVDAFDRAGRGNGPLLVQYELCARSMSKLLRAGGVVLDLGSGSGRFLAYFADRRPDASLIGLELSQPMARAGQRLLAEQQLASRVRIEQGDFTSCAESAPARVDLLSSILALHQLPAIEDLLRALQQIAEIRAQSGCAVWLWDLARLRDDATMHEWLSQEPDLDPLFVRDALASEAAAWTPAELRDALAQSGLADLRAAISRPPLLQAHWAPSREPKRADAEAAWHDVALAPALRRRALALRLGFRGLP